MIKTVIDICKICGKEYNKTSNVQKYCSRTCAAKARLPYLKNWIKDNPKRMLLRGAKWRAKKRKLAFDISLDDIIIPERCPILDIDLKLNQTGKPGFFNNSYSLDRIDPNKGYIKGNVRVISNRANLLKSNASIEELNLVLKDLQCNVRS